jgi:N,N'-diacetylbacillosaminyl-diphospho-undecaprenol alpha-1,3-N-acetylgalactosaminyltransferase
LSWQDGGGGILDKKKIKIAFLASLDINLYLFRLAWMQELNKEGYSVTAVVPEGEFFEKIVQQGINAVNYRMVRRSINPFREILTIIQLWRIFRREKFDIVHTFTIKPNIYGAFAARLAGTRIVINHVTGLGYVHTENTTKTFLLRLLLSVLYRISFKICHRIIFQNPEDFKILKSFLDPQKVLLIKGTGVDTDYFDRKQADQKQVERLKNELKISNKSVVITLIARLLRHKGVEEFIEAAKLLLPRYPDLIFLVVGWKDEGNPSAVTDDFIAQARRQERVVFLGKRDDIREILAITDIYALPSYREGIPRTVMEAMSMERPVVASDVPGCRDIVVDGENGLLVPARDSAALSRALEKLVLDPVLRKNFGQANRIKVIAELSNSIIIDQVLRVYEHLERYILERKKIKICIVTTVPISVSSFYGKQLGFLSQNGFEVTVITSSSEGLDKFINGTTKLVLVGLTRVISPLKDIKAFFQMYGIFRKSGFDIVQYSSPKAALIASSAAWLCGVPVRLYLMWGIYYTGQQGLKKRIFKLIEKLTCFLSTHVSPDSHGNMIFAMSQGLCKANKMSVVGMGSANGLDLERFDPTRFKEQRGDLRKSLDIPPEAVVIGFLGRLRSDKGVNELIKAFSRLSRENDRLYLVLIGPQETREHPLENEVQEEIRTNHKIKYLGFQQETEKFLSIMDIFVLPSYREGFGVVNLEASAMRLPVISTDIPGPRDSVLNNKTGILVKAKTVEPLAEAMQKLILDPVLRGKMGEAGRQWVTNFEQGKHWQAIKKHRLNLLRKAHYDV